MDQQESNLNLSQMELNLIKQALNKHKNNKTKAAQELGITVKTLYNKLHYHQIFDLFSSGRSKRETSNES